VSTDGLKHELGIKSTSQLKYAVDNLINGYNANNHISEMKAMTNTELSETEFAQVVGRSRMYKHIPDYAKKDIPAILFGDQQLSSVVHDYYKDKNFGNEEGGSISMWQFYNLLTGANKSTYIDSFLDRGVNASDFTHELIKHKMGTKRSWFIG
jgi:hypothetical protein